ncbi:MAG: hypothetical protein DMF73_02850 [Acidobacteria bacterium]|nr:MAG: hypothetical protein DMF73_02850 [Acidobacteriota bacterium]
MKANCGRSSVQSTRCFAASTKIVVKVDVDGDGQYDDKAYTVRAREVYNAPKPEAASSGKTGGGKQ